MPISFGANKSKSQSNMNQDVWQPQEQAFTDYYGAQNNLWQNSMPYMNMGMGMMNQAMPYMQNAANYGQGQADYMGQGGSFGDTSGMRDSLYTSLQDSMNSPSNTGRMYEDIVGGAGNTYIDPMVDSMKSGMMENRDKMISGNSLAAAGMGQSGSNRHAMQNAMTDRNINTDMANMENQMRGDAYDTDLNWKMDIAKQADLGRGQAQDRSLAALSGGDQNRQMGMNYMPTQQNLGMGMMAPWQQAAMMPWQMMGAYGAGMGDPTVLSSGSSSGSAFGMGGKEGWMG